MAVANAEESIVGLPSLQPLWHDKTPKDLLDHCPSTDAVAGWKTWQDHLSSREKPAAPPFLKKRRPAVLWGWPPEWDHASLAVAIATPASMAETVIGEDVAALPELPLALEMVALAYALPDLAKELPAEAWWYLVERLHVVATQAHSQRVGWPAAARDVLRDQLLAGELPLALAYTFPEVRALRALRDEARTALSEALVAVTDGQGLPHVRLLPVLGPLFACWTRARWLGARLKGGSWSRGAESQYQWLVRNAIRLADTGGRFLLSSPGNGRGLAAAAAWTKPLFRCALELAGDRGDIAAAIEAVPRGAVTKKQRRKARSAPCPSLNSDWSGITVMAEGWSQKDVRLAITHANEPMSIELSVAGESLLSGKIESRTLCEGQPLEASGEWEQLCWESGKRFDFVELRLQLSAGIRIERQFILGRRDRVLYIADMVIAGDERLRIRHSLGLPLDRGARWQPEPETRDGVISRRNVRAAVLPMALSEWRSDPRGGTLECSDGRLTLTQTAHGTALCCPVFFDLNSKRTHKERTWRQLTVGENMEIVPRDVAAGFCAESGRGQWLFYRSLGPVGNRTVMGQNISGEFSAGRFYPSGQYEEWIEIEAV